MKNKTLVWSVSALMCLVSPLANADMDAMITEVQDYVLPQEYFRYETQALRWDFSKSNHVQYNYDQDLNIRMFGEGLKRDQSVSASVGLELKKDGDHARWQSIGDGLANITITDDGQVQKQQQLLPAFVLDGYTESGEFLNPLVAESMAMQTWFILPEAQLEFGEWVYQPLKYPVNVQNEQVYGTGKIGWMISNWVPCNDSKCVQIEMDYKIENEDFDVPEHIKDKMIVQADLLGTGRAFFDVENKRFFGYKGALSLHLYLLDFDKKPILGFAMDSIIRVEEKP